jgi:hypothetical protein
MHTFGEEVSSRQFGIRGVVYNINIYSEYVVYVLLLCCLTDYGKFFTRKFHSGKVPPKLAVKSVCIYWGCGKRDLSDFCRNDDVSFTLVLH